MFKGRLMAWKIAALSWMQLANIVCTYFMPSQMLVAITVASIAGVAALQEIGYDRAPHWVAYFVGGGLWVLYAASFAVLVVSARWSRTPVLASIWHLRVLLNAIVQVIIVTVMFVVMGLAYAKGSRAFDPDMLQSTFASDWRVHFRNNRYLRSAITFQGVATFGRHIPPPSTTPCYRHPTCSRPCHNVISATIRRHAVLAHAHALVDVVSGARAQLCAIHLVPAYNYV